jgi:kinesin family protein C1
LTSTFPDYVANISETEQKTPSYSSFGSTRNTSLASSVSSRTASVSSRNTSNGSFSSSMGPSHGRSQSAHLGRPQTSMAFSQSTMTRPSNTGSKSRPNTSMSNHSDDADLPNPGKRKGMPQLASRSSSFQLSRGSAIVQNKKLRPAQSVSSFKSPNAKCNIREVSITTAMSRMHIDEIRYHQQKEHRAASRAIMPPPKLSHKSSVSTEFRELRSPRSHQSLLLYEDFENCLVAVSPKTPSHLPVARTKRGTVQAPPTTPSSPSKISPIKTPYLTKDSDLPAFTEWDVRGRLEDVEAMYAEMKANMAGSTLERNGLEEAIAIYKQRSRSRFTRLG